MAWVLDVNVVLALMHGRHCHAGRAAQWLDGRAGTGCCLVCRVVQMGVLRLLTHPAVMKEEVLTPVEFWGGWDTLMGDERMSLVSEPRGLERAWRDLTARLPAGMSAGTDAYLAALARSGGWRLATFDRGIAVMAPADVEVIA